MTFRIVEGPVVRVSGVEFRRRGRIFDAQLLILEDPMLVGRASELVREDRER